MKVILVKRIIMNLNFHLKILQTLTKFLRYQIMSNYQRRRETMGKFQILRFSFYIDVKIESFWKCFISKGKRNLHNNSKGKILLSQHQILPKKAEKDERN